MAADTSQPELEALTLQHMATGRFQSVSEAVFPAFRSLSGKEKSPALDTPKKNLTQFLKESPLWSSGLEFERSKDLPRPTDL